MKCLKDCLIYIFLAFGAVYSLLLILLYFILSSCYENFKYYKLFQDISQIFKNYRRPLQFLIGLIGLIGNLLYRLFVLIVGLITLIITLIILLSSLIFLLIIKPIAVIDISYNAKHSSTILAIPFPYIFSYPKECNYLLELLIPNFSKLLTSSDNHEEFYKYLNGKALIEFKWNTYGWKYYLAIWAVYTIYFCCFIIVSTLSNNISWFYQKFFLNTVVILGFWHLFFEIRQFIYSLYFSSIWNYFDLAAIISTTATSIYWLRNDSNINMFAQFGSAIIALYYMMITGDSTPISTWISNENIVIMILMIIVSFFMLIYLMNLFIGILSDLISNEDNEIAYWALKNEIIEEIELLYMLPHQRRKENWFPFVIFYECHTDKLHAHIKDIQNDNWSGYNKPIFSKNLEEILQLNEE
ncbi:hypothetical protein F8M41_010236 [Gigaspora margarita]|uniref:Ion transport domain-containing protein n=1 Tax=Gigaspora margarita TaxID=4874 RepID=A0A8H4AUH1_GIGMA|nr:hypothetical protein F8M41_010236 [Gigaspora margarita]